MYTFLIATVGLATFYGALWHNQPARSPNREKQDEQDGTRPPELIATLSAVNAKHDRDNDRNHVVERPSATLGHAYHSA